MSTRTTSAPSAARRRAGSASRLRVRARTGQPSASRCSLMREPSGFESRTWLVGLPVAEYCVQDVDAASGQRDDGLVVGLAGGTFAVVVGAADRIALQGAERRLVEDAFEDAVAAGGPLQVADLPGLLQGRRDTRGRG